MRHQTSWGLDTFTVEVHQKKMYLNLVICLQLVHIQWTRQWDARDFKARPPASL